MGEGCSHEAVHRRRIDPGEKGGHLCLDLSCRRRLEVDALPAEGSRHDPHRAVGIIPPSSDGDRRESGASGGKQRGLPAPQAFARQRGGMVLGRVEHHLDHPLGASVLGAEAGVRDAKAAGDGRADTLALEHLTLDLRALQDFLSDG